ncbi:MAG: hypothetical protein WBX30_20160 [Stellaceae bacterium]
MALKDKIALGVALPHHSPNSSKTAAGVAVRQSFGNATEPLIWRRRRRAVSYLSWSDFG